MQLTKNFPLRELLRSQAATRNDILEQFDPISAIKENLRQLCIHILQTLRESKGRAIFVNSVGFLRSLVLSMSKHRSPVLSLSKYRSSNPLSKENSPTGIKANTVNK